MDTLVTLDCDSWFCQSTLYDRIIDILWKNGLHHEVRAHDDEVSILNTSDTEHMIICEYIFIVVPEP